MAMEIIKGKMKLIWNFGFPDGPQSAFVPKYDDVTEEGKLLIKAGYVPSRKLVAVSVNVKWVEVGCFGTAVPR